MSTPFVHSNFERVAGDYYPTIDERCVDGFLQHFKPKYRVIDPCAPDGSGIVNTLVKRGYDAVCGSDAFAAQLYSEWVVTNPPYDRKLVDKIINKQLEHVESGVTEGLAVLLRSGFDFAKSRCDMFEHNPFYAGQIKLTFRPWWSEDHSQAPIHNFVWQIWMHGIPAYNQRVWYADGRKP